MDPTTRMFKQCITGGQQGVPRLLVLGKLGQQRPMVELVVFRRPAEVFLLPPVKVFQTKFVNLVALLPGLHSPHAEDPVALLRVLKLYPLMKSLD